MVSITLECSKASVFMRWTTERSTFSAANTSRGIAAAKTNATRVKRVGNIGDITQDITGRHTVVPKHGCRSKDCLVREVLYVYDREYTRFRPHGITSGSCAGRSWLLRCAEKAHLYGICRLRCSRFGRRRTLHRRTAIRETEGAI